MGVVLGLVLVLWLAVTTGVAVLLSAAVPLRHHRDGDAGRAPRRLVRRARGSH